MRNFLKNVPLILGALILLTIDVLRIIYISQGPTLDTIRYAGSLLLILGLVIRLITLEHTVDILKASIKRNALPKDRPPKR